MKIKRWLPVLLWMLLCVGLMPTTALAAEEYKILIGGVWVTSDNAADVLRDGGSVVYNPETNTVTLTGAKLTSNIYCETGSALNIVVNGTNTMDCTGNVATGISNFGNNPINISGNGKLTITVEITEGSAIRGNNVTIDGTELELYTSGEAIQGYPLTIQNKANVTATVTGSGSVAINAGDLKITGGSTLTAISPLGNSMIADSIEIENSTVTGTGYYPVMSWVGDITITDSTVYAESTADWGIWSNGNLTITGKSNVTATGSIAALGAGGSFTLEPPAGEGIDVFAGTDPDNAPAIEGSPLSQATDLSSYGNPNIKYFHSVPHQHVTTLVAKVEPTCTTEGKEAYYVCACGKYFEDEAGETEITDLENYGIMEAQGHTMVKHSEMPATCTEPGNIAYWQCETCGIRFADEEGTEEITSVETPALGHHAVKTEAKAPTTTEPGNIEYWYCERCGKYFTDEALTQEITQEQTHLAATGETTPSTPEETPANPPKDTSDPGASDIPQTGDDSNRIVWVALMFAAGAALTGILLYRHKKKYSR